MIFRIATKETRDLLRDNRFQWTASLLLVLLAVSFIVGWQHYKEVTALRVEAEASQRAQWLNKKMDNAHIAAHAGTVVFRPYMPLSAIDKGLDSYVGISMFLEAHRRSDFQNELAMDSATAGQRFGEVTTALILQVLVPLLIILLTFSTFAGEREQGTLRQLLSLGVRHRDLAFGKVLGVASPLLLILLPVTVLGVIAFVFWNESGAINLPRIALMFFSYLTYFVVFFGISLIVSATSATTQRALVVLLGFWFITCLMMPPVALEIGERLHRTPTKEELAGEVVAEDSVVERHTKRLAAVEKELMAKYDVDTVKQLPVNPNAVLLAQYEEEGTKTQNESFNKLYGAYEQQNAVYQIAALVSPVLAVQSLSMSFSGNDTNHHRHFAEVAEAYRYRLTQTMNEDLINHPRTNGDRAAVEAAFSLRERQVYESVPSFQYTAPDWRWAVDKSKLSIALLLAWFIGVLMATSLAISKMRVD